jgi:hypothetical protein
MGLKDKKELISSSKDFLDKTLESDQVLWTILKHCSASGMKRVLSVVYIKNNEPYDISKSIAVLIGWRYSSAHNGVIVSGVGMDVGFHLVETLSRILNKKLTHKWL